MNVLLGAATTVFIKLKVSIFQRALIREVPLFAVVS